MNRKQRRAQEKTAGRPMAAATAAQAEAARLNDLALQRHAAGASDEAMALLRQAIARDGTNAIYHNNLGELLRLAGDTDAAAGCLDRAITLNPRYADAQINRGNLLRQLKRPAEAADAYRAALAIRPDYPEGLGNLGAALHDLKDYAAAIEVLRRAIALKPGIATFHQNLGLALQASGDIAAAEQAFGDAIRLEPGMVDTLLALGDVERGKGDLDGAIAWYERAWRLKPGHGDAHHRYGTALMVKGDYGQAWPHFGARWNLAEMAGDRRPFKVPFWQGQPLPPGGRLLLFTEQGVGESLCLLGLVPEILARGIAPVIECDRRMVPLLQRSFPGLEILAREKPANPRLFAADLVMQASLFDLAAVLRRSPADCTGLLPLRVDSERAARLRQQYRAGGDRPLVGIAWHSGNIRLGAPKSALLTDFAAFAALPGYRFVDLQYGNRADDRAALTAACGAEILHDPAIDQLQDLDAFAAQVAAMDLVITTSNTTAHMAAALGKPVWVLLHKGISPHWYWGRDGAATPWYPTARLFRQQAAGDWAGLAAEVAAELKRQPPSATS